jgi:hypothetical protein
MFPEILPENGENLLDLLTKANLLNNFYLAEGTGLALQIRQNASNGKTYQLARC